MLSLKAGPSVSWGISVFVLITNINGKLTLGGGDFKLPTEQIFGLGEYIGLSSSNNIINIKIDNLYIHNAIPIEEPS